jgi:hypothetical protein
MIKQRITFNEIEFIEFKKRGSKYVEYEGFRLWGKYLYKPMGKEIYITKILPKEEYPNCGTFFISEENTGFCDWLTIEEATYGLVFMDEVRQPREGIAR